MCNTPQNHRNDKTRKNQSKDIICGNKSQFFLCIVNITSYMHDGQNYAEGQNYVHLSVINMTYMTLK